MNPVIAQIQAAFERDQTRIHEEVHHASELPLCYEAITDDWLSAVLCAAHPAARVLGHSLGAPDSGTSNRRRIAVRYNQAGQQAGLPTALFCKASHALENRMVLGLAGALQAEVHFYSLARPLLDIEAPVCHFARFDPESFNSLIMLSDLAVQGAQFCSHATEMSRARAESQIRLLADLHGAGYCNPALQAQLPQFVTWPAYFANTLAFGMKEGSEAGFLDAEAVVPPRLHRRQREIWPATLASVARHDSLPHTLVHGDVHLKNWYIAGNGEMGLSDWQGTTRGHWGRDFAYTISTALTVENRRAWERELLQLYLDRLQAAAGLRVDFTEAWRHYRQQLMTALTWWTITLHPAPGMPDMQPRDLTLEFIRRISTAMDDLDSLDSFS